MAGVQEKLEGKLAGPAPSLLRRARNIYLKTTVAQPVVGFHLSVTLRYRPGENALIFPKLCFLLRKDSLVRFTISLLITICGRDGLAVPSIAHIDYNPWKSN